MVLGVVFGPVEILQPKGLGVLAHDDLAGEGVGMIDDAPDQAAQQVRVRAAALVPDVVDLDDYPVGGGDGAVGPGMQRFNVGLVELEPLAPHQREQVVQTDEPVADRVLRAVGDVEDSRAVVGGRVAHGSPVGVGAAKVTPYAGGQEQAQRRYGNADGGAESSRYPPTSRDHCGDQRRAEGERGRRQRRLLTRIGEPAGLGSAAQQQPAQREESAEQRIGQKPAPQEVPARMTGDRMFMFRICLGAGHIVGFHLDTSIMACRGAWADEPQHLGRNRRHAQEQH